MLVCGEGEADTNAAGSSDRDALCVNATRAGLSDVVVKRSYFTIVQHQPQPQVDSEADHASTNTKVCRNATRHKASHEDNPG